ncbi:hypothetical protein ZYGR_0Z01860 [Zygosaccharomyces rouxii]|uniref:ZYRO0G04598p n=2 Tax=Zygosaccharomyces rouxii TaxID=4956 RepID=C5DZI0_ZYGRC|nr:uncharacterized protein ZYRO0G04598g [Zygosaccharomyces rouxii]KAH9202263.1 hypothetical protein LQ764DRAFT_4752 [Zygosaccharomyces rouxii]GAV50763.1 hypothetical protein ZYGR_0Z01860 [Zygosaccharomyces rouxii]CAR29264.1 ZYRO0G04598p [Zygosaccharomyces rouxii]
MADCLCENFPNYNFMGSKRTADFEDRSQEECVVRYNKKIKREPLTPPRESSCEVENKGCSPYWEVEEYMVRGYESIQDVQCSLYDLTPEEELERQCDDDDGEVPRIDCDIDMM